MSTLRMLAKRMEGSLDKLHAEHDGKRWVVVLRGVVRADDGFYALAKAEHDELAVALSDAEREIERQESLYQAGLLPGYQPQDEPTCAADFEMF